MSILLPYCYHITIQFLVILVYFNIERFYTHIVRHNYESIAVHGKKIYQTMRFDIRNAEPIEQFSSWGQFQTMFYYN